MITLLIIILSVAMFGEGKDISYSVYLYVGFLGKIIYILIYF